MYSHMHNSIFMRQIRLLLPSLLVLGVFGGACKPKQISFGAANTQVSTRQFADNVNASDGTYEKFVLIRWEATDKGGDYRLFRASSPNGASMKELTKSWQKSNWFCDYSAEKGRDYYYAIMESDGKKSTPLSKFDKGFLRKPETIAQEESLSSTGPDRYAAAKVLFMLVSEVSIDTISYAAGSSVPVQVGLQNIFEEAVSSTDVRVYLSRDAAWDFEDQLLVSKRYSGFPSGFKGNVNEKVRLPNDLLPSMYYLIVVTAPDGNILHAKTGSTPIYTRKQ
jgi:hypothetical protein